MKQSLARLVAEEQSRDWLEKSPVCTKILDLDFNLQYMSSAGLTALKIDDIEAYYGTPFPFDFYTEISREAIRLDLKKALDTNRVVTYERPVQSTDGETLWFHTTIVPVLDSPGDGYLIVISIDVNERKLLEEELQKSHKLFSQAEQMGKMGHWEWDVLDDKLMACSEQYAAIFDMTVEEALDTESYLKPGDAFDPEYVYEKDALEYLHEEDRENYIQVTDAAYEQKAPWQIEFRIISKLGRVVHVLEQGEPVLNSKGELIRTFGTLQDITQSKKAEAQLNYQANHDDLTGLINRREFERRAERLLSSIPVTRAEHALCFIDLDQFKVVNDTCGHTAGDELLRQVATLLDNTVRHRDTLARLGGDEFGLLMEHCSLQDANRVVDSILQTINEFQFSWEGKLFKIGASIGLTPITETTASVASLLADADAACYMAKDAGRNRAHIHRPGDAEMAQRHGEMQWVARLNKALQEDRFELFAQIIAPLHGQTETKYEILLRMVEEDGTSIPPGAFLPAAERYNLIGRLDKWVVENTFKLLATRPSFIDKIESLSINLSGYSVADSAFKSELHRLFRKSGISGEKICFEITETTAITNLNRAVEFIDEMSAEGCRFALDDFGSGLSSFAYLKNLPVDYLKIDGMFVRDIVEDPIDHAMVKSINDIGQVMGMKTIAEFVENDAILEKLKSLGVNYAQGYGVGKPIPFLEVLEES